MAKFSDAFLKKLKPKEKSYDLYEPGGLTIRVRPSGSKTFLYKYVLNYKTKRITIGQYPAVTLGDARQKVREYETARANGNDPASAKAISKNATFGAMFLAYLESEAQRLSDGGSEIKRTIEKDVLPEISNTPAGSVTRTDIVRIIDKIGARGSTRQANVAQENISRIYNWGLDHGWPGLEVSPTYRMKKRFNENERERILSPREIAQLWLCIDKHEMSYGVVRTLCLTLLTGQRPGECLRISYDEIDGEWWTIPAERAKNRQAHRVYLTETAKRLIGEGEKGLAFPGKEGAPSSTNILSKSVRRAIEREEKNKRNTLPRDWTPHDLRRTCASQLAELGYSDDLIDRLLNHKQTKIRRTYNRYEYDAEKKKMMLAWEKRLKGILKREIPQLMKGVLS